jgi:hypothetical protein
MASLPHQPSCEHVVARYAVRLAILETERRAGLGVAGSASSGEQHGRARVIAGYSFAKDVHPRELGARGSIVDIAELFEHRTRAHWIARDALTLLEPPDHLDASFGRSRVARALQEQHAARGIRYDARAADEGDAKAAAGTRDSHAARAIEKAYPLRLILRDAVPSVVE